MLEYVHGSLNSFPETVQTFLVISREMQNKWNLIFQYSQRNLLALGSREEIILRYFYFTYCVFRKTQLYSLELGVSVKVRKANTFTKYEVLLHCPMPNAYLRVF